MGDMGPFQGCGERYASPAPFKSTRLIPAPIFLLLLSLQNKKLNTPIAKTPSGTPTPTPIFVPRSSPVLVQFACTPCEFCEAVAWAGDAVVPVVALAIAEDTAAAEIDCTKASSPGLKATPVVPSVNELLQQDSVPKLQQNLVGAPPGSAHDHTAAQNGSGFCVSGSIHKLIISLDFLTPAWVSISLFKHCSNWFGQFAEPQLWSVQLPRYTNPDAPKQNPLTEQESFGSQHAEAVDIVWLHGTCVGSEVLLSGYQHVAAAFTDAMSRGARSSNRPMFGKCRMKNQFRFVGRERKSAWDADGDGEPSILEPIRIPMPLILPHPLGSRLSLSRHLT